MHDPGEAAAEMTQTDGCFCQSQIYQHYKQHILQFKLLLCTTYPVDPFPLLKMRQCKLNFGTDERKKIIKYKETAQTTTNYTEKERKKKLFY